MIQQPKHVRVQVLTPVQYARYITTSFPYMASIDKMCKVLADKVNLTCNICRGGV